MDAQAKFQAPWRPRAKCALSRFHPIRTSMKRSNPNPPHKLKATTEGRTPARRRLHRAKTAVSAADAAADGGAVAAKAS